MAEIEKNEVFPKLLDKSELRWTCDESKFDFNSTEEIEPLVEIVGQPRAVDAINLGVNLQSKGYNIFVTGISGTGRTTTVKKIVEENIKQNGQETEIFDFCYVNNFENQDTPRLIRMKKGNAKIFQRGMDSAIDFLKEKLPGHFESENFQSGKKNIIEQYKKQEQKELGKYDKKVESMGFVRGQLDNGKGQIQPDIFIKLGEAVHRIEELNELVQTNKLNEEEATKIEKIYGDLKQELFDFMRNTIKYARQMKQDIINYDKEMSADLVDSAFDGIRETIENEKVTIYLKEVIDYVLDHLDIFVKPVGLQDPDPQKVKNDFNVFKVNVILDNSGVDSRPVIIETNPNYTNLFGTIDKDYDKRGFWHSDFTRIHAGSLLKADQGFLLVNANDIFSEPGVWQALKRVLLYEKLDIQNFDSLFHVSQSSLKPEEIQVSVKVIIIGGMTLYSMLYNHEKGFKKMFKVLAQFDESIIRDDEMIQDYPRFIAKICEQENIPHADKSAVAALMEWSAEYAGSKNKISLRFSDVNDMIREAGYYTQAAGKKFITRETVNEAKNGRKFRYGLVDEKISNAIKEESIFVSTEGERVGQINGLTVYSTGLFSFGKPARITAAIAIGNKGIVNIEREAGMSGKIHNKGMMIISGFIYERFGSKTPLALTASIAFEQSYGGIDGDSASAAEIYVLLSAITGKPIKQNFAITGSMNQKGDIQPIGGVNEKITGFFELCRDRGFTGDQAVIIPKQNIKDLMLGQEIIDEVEKGNFAVHAIENIEEGVPLLFEMEAGIMEENGEYTKDSLFELTAKKMKELRDAAKAKPGKLAQRGQKDKLKKVSKKKYC